MTTPRATPLIIADRGASADAPEHTIAAFELALDQGADGIALDVHLDARRAAGRHPRLHPRAHHRRRGSGCRPHDARAEAPGRRSLADRRFRASACRPCKRSSSASGTARASGSRSRAARTSIRASRSAWCRWSRSTRWSDQILIQSIDLAALALIRTLNRRSGLGAAGGSGHRSSPVLLRPDEPGASAICSGAEILTATRREAKSEGAGLACYVWDGNDRPRLDRFVEWGVNGIITDRPSLLRTRLGR